MPKFRIYVNSALKWTGNAPDEYRAIEAAAKKAGQIWQVRFDTLPDGEATTGRIFLHTDHDTPNMITDIRPLKIVPLIHDARQWKPGARDIMSAADFLNARSAPAGHVQTFNAGNE